jgi:hypothetical protein
MTRILGILLLLVILRLAVKSFSNQLKTAVFGSAPAPKSPPRPRAAVAETLVRCAACGTYIVPSRALKGKGDEVFCSEGCRKPGAG